MSNGLSHSLDAIDMLSLDHVLDTTVHIVEQRGDSLIERRQQAFLEGVENVAVIVPVLNPADVGLHNRNACFDEAARQGERTLYVTLSETREEINRVARSHGWSLDPLGILELSAMKHLAEPTARQTLFHSAEVELHEVTSPILAEIDRLQASAIVIDSLSEIRLLSGELLRFRRQILALKQFFAERRCTVLMLDDRTGQIAALLEKEMGEL